MEPQEERSTEHTILRIAERLFLEQGFARTSTTQIAREAGCNQALVHYYFRTKEQLFGRVFADKLRVFITEFLGAYTQGTTFEQRISGIVETHYRILAQNPRLPALILGEIASDPTRVAALKAVGAPIAGQLFGRLEADLREEIAAGRVRPMDGRDLLMDILSLDALPFIAAPLLTKVLGIPGEEIDVFYARRCEAVKRTLINSLRV